MAGNDMDNFFKFISFTLDKQHYGLPISIVNKVLPIAEITSLPKYPPFILGVINIHGNILPVIDIRYLLGLPQKEVNLLDRLIIINMASQNFMLIIDSVTAISKCLRSDIIPADQAAGHQKEPISGILKQNKNLIFILDIEKLLSQNDLQIIEGLEKRGVV
jgi:purine-binding chemotaxis protein CheW